MKMIMIYLVIINVVSFFMMWEDKRRAVKNRYRIPEKVFFLSSLLGGSVGAWCGMYRFRHKTRHWYFVVGMPLILFAQIVAVFCVYYNLMD